MKTVGVWVLAAVGAGLVGRWQGIISLYLLIQMTLNGVHLVPVKLHQEWICPTPTCCANVCSHSTCLLLFLALFWEWQLEEWLFPSQKNWWNRGFEFPTPSCTNTFSLLSQSIEKTSGVWRSWHWWVLGTTGCLVAWFEFLDLWFGFFPFIYFFFLSHY